MPTSQNGWPVDPPRRSRLVSGTPDVRVTVADGPAGDVLMYVLAQVHVRVEPLTWDSVRGELDDWGYAPRPIRGGTETSNHASATAVDANATRHPLGARATFSPAQVAEIHQILAEVDHAVRWGGDYVGRKDEMHFEINAPAAVVAVVAARLKGGSSMQVTGLSNAAVQSILDFPMTVVGLDGKPQTAALKVWIGADGYRNAETRQLVIQILAIVKAVLADLTNDPDITLDAVGELINQAVAENAPRAEAIAGMLLPPISQFLREELAAAFDAAAEPATPDEIADRVVARLGGALVAAAGEVAEVRPA